MIKYQVSDFNGDALLALSKLNTGGALVIDIPISPISPLIVTTPYVVIENSLYGPGTISNGFSFDNKMWDCIDKDQVVVSKTPPTFVNFKWT